MGLFSKKKREVERIMVVVGVNNSCFPIFVSGKSVENEASEGGEDFIIQVMEEGLTKNDPDYGLWVWVGNPIEVFSGDGEGEEEFDGWDFSGGEWRKPTAQEVAGVVAGVNPWNVEESLVGLLDKSPTKLKTRCPTCGMSQFDTPSGPSCISGHGDSPVGGEQSEKLKKLESNCSVCGLSQYETPSGPCCIRGHGGAPAKDEP